MNIDIETCKRLYENCDPYELRNNGINSLEKFIDVVNDTDINIVISYLLDEIDEIE